MAARNEIKKVTYEDKFERRWWVDNKAKRNWIRWTKRFNNRQFRRIKNNVKIEEIEE